MNTYSRLCSRLVLAAATALSALDACPCSGQSDEPRLAQRRTRKLAPGVMTQIPPDLRLEETVSAHDIVELVAVDPKFDFAKNLRFRRDIWCLEFSFKPIRMIWVDIPTAEGHMRRELIWYMVYSVTNRGQALHPVKQPNGTFAGERIDIPVRLIPKFILRSHELGTEYSDCVIPLALGPIIAREDPGPDWMADPAKEFYNSVTIGKEPIAVGETRWGIAMWQGIDPRIDFFSIYVRGLTNAYHWQDSPETYTPGKDPIGKGRKFVRKTLKLNFWRPGDEYYEDENEIRYGIPGQVDYEWVYR
ncbi:MAG: hypothetical protein PHN77_13485 [Thermoguttaceae bacterium]|jgi:hypothetical protein|nr:hypothetical protein [Thermoguttaceae bacterium]